MGVGFEGDEVQVARGGGRGRGWGRERVLEALVVVEPDHFLLEDAAGAWRFFLEMVDFNDLRDRNLFRISFS